MTTAAKPEPKAQGSFSKTPFSHILVYLVDRSMSGTLVVKDDHNEVIVYFQDGTPAKVKTTVPGRTLGIVLRKLGMVPEQSLKQAEETAVQTADLLGRVLIANGAIDAPSLIRGLRQQLLVQLTDVFAMTGADYAFYERVNLLHGVGSDELFPLDPFPLIMSGLRKHGKRLDLDSLCNSLKGKLVSVKDEESIRRFKLLQKEKDFLEELFEQSYSYDSLVSGRRFDPEMVKYLLYGLCITRLVSIEATGHEEELIEEEEETEERRTSRLESLEPAPYITAEDPELAEKRKKILGKASEIAVQNYYEMLGLNPSDSPDKARLAFFRLAKVFHPDKIAPELASELRETIQYIFTNLSAAHTTLTDPDSKEEYDSALKSGTDSEGSPEISEEEAHVRSVLEGENLYQKALVHLRRNQDDTARELVAKALALSAENGEHKALWAHLEWKRRPKDADNQDLLSTLRQVVEKNPKSERAHLYLAQVLKTSGLLAQAMQHFEKVLSINAHNIEAARELHIMKMRAKSTKEKSGGFLSRFLK